MSRRISRREFLTAAGATAGVAALAACGAPQAAPTKAPEKAAATAAATAAPAAKGPEPLMLPIVKEPLTFSYWVELNSNVSASKKNYSEMGCYQEIEKKTGVKIEFQHPPTGQAAEQFNLVI